MQHSAKSNIYNKIFRYIIFLYLILFSNALFCEELCETAPDTPEIQDIISLIKMRLNIVSLKCSFTATSDISKECLDFLEKFNYVDIHGRDIRGIVSERNLTQNFDEFVWQGGNYYKSFTFVSKGIEELEKEHKKEPRNIVELLSLKRGPYSKLTPEEKVLVNTRRTFFYSYNGILKMRTNLYDINLKREVVHQRERDMQDNHDPYSYYLDPRICLGFCMEYQPITVHTAWFKPIYLTKFIDKKGKYYYEERDGYRILWHIAEDEKMKVLIPYGVEVWVDKDGNISKLAINTYPSRILSKSKLEEISGETNLNCHYPCITFIEYRYSDFKDFGNGIRLPMHAKIVKRGMFSEIDPVVNEMIKEFKFRQSDDYYNTREIISIIKINKHLNGFIPFTESEVIIHPESVRINEPIPEKTFLAPEYEIPLGKAEEIKEAYHKLYKKELSKQKSPIEKTTKIPIPTLLFIIGAIGITILGIFITKRYFGWGT